MPSNPSNRSFLEASRILNDLLNNIHRLPTMRPRRDLQLSPPGLPARTRVPALVHEHRAILARRAAHAVIRAVVPCLRRVVVRHRGHFRSALGGVRPTLHVRGTSMSLDA